MAHPDQSQFDGMAADTKVAILGAQFSTGDDLELGEKVTLLVYGHVIMTGREVLESEGERGVVKIHADVIERQHVTP
jgi:hypothetical protein